MAKNNPDSSPFLITSYTFQKSNAIEKIDFCHRINRFHSI